ncbi:MAG TPA: ATP-binding protein [Solirubrobacterales bacterium]|nr:ATP-binding protein [Solirubrobacterales bacterium]
MRLWLGAAFALVSLITAASVYIFVDDSSGRTLQSESADLAVGKTASLADDLGRLDKLHAANVLAMSNTPTFKAWALNRHGRPFAPGQSFAGLDALQQRPEAFRVSLNGRRYTASSADNVTVAAAPVFGTGKVPVRGVVVVRAEPPPALTHAFDELRGDRLRALMIAIVIGVLVGFLASTVIATRIRRLASSAEQMAAGDFDAPLPPGGGDEVGDLTRALDKMRRELRKTFGMLATERDRLSAVFDGLTEAVIVAAEDGEVRFTNAAAGRLVRDGRPAAALTPSLRRAAQHGADEIPVLAIDGRLYGVQARQVPAEQAVLLVVRDRTEELKREQAEAEFVSNAAHELRNPLAGIKSGIEVLQAGAKDDPEVRDTFLDRLGDDAERMTRLTQSLLMLARVEAAGGRDPEQVVDVTLSAREAFAAIEEPDGVDLLDETDDDLVAEGDPVLLRQVMIGLLSNACAYTPAPGTVTLRASRGPENTVTIEVQDTGKGIPPEEQDRVFERFYRGSGILEREGFGLGLSIAKRMVDVMGGQIGLRSKPGEGSTFWVRLRAAKPTPTPVA